jgi:class 3 adenylate cyclase
MYLLRNQFFELASREIQRYEGTINQFLGDGFMTLFGAPIAHEDHPRRAVLAALGLRKGLEERRPSRETFTLRTQGPHGAQHGVGGGRGNGRPDPEGLYGDRRTSLPASSRSPSPARSS